MATETKKPEAAAAAAPPIEARCLTLRQKLVEMRKACPEIVKKQHSDGVSYKYAKIYDVWEKITPIMNELGVDFDVIAEEATRHAENGDPVYWITMQTKTYKGDKLMFLYEADLTIRWTNLDNDDETLEAVVHALGWNDDPAKAKGAAHTYALKYYLFEKFSIDQGEDDPDNSDFGAQSKGPGGRLWRLQTGPAAPGAGLWPPVRGTAQPPLQEGRGRRHDQGAHHRPDPREVQEAGSGHPNPAGVRRDLQLPRRCCRAA